MQEISDIQEVFGNPGILDILECRAIQAVRARVLETGPLVNFPGSSARRSATKTAPWCTAW